MADLVKVLGQVALPATTLTDLYTVPALTQTTVSSITVCNLGGSQTSFRVAIAVGGVADDPEQYLYYDLLIPSADTFIATIGVTLGPADVVRGYAAAANVTMQVFGVETT